MMDESKNLNSVDIAKFVMAVAVVAIHVQALYISTGDEPIYPFFLQWFITLAVPFFFVVSGWLIHRKVTSLSQRESYEYLKDKARKTLKILCLWLMIYMPIAIYHYVEIEKPWFSAIIGYIYNVVVSGQTYFACPLWYLYALFIGLCILCISINRPKSLYCAFVGFVIAYLIGRNFIDISTSGTVTRVAKVLCIKPLGGVFISFQDGSCIIQNSQVWQ